MNDIVTIDKIKQALPLHLQPYFDEHANKVMEGNTEVLERLWARDWDRKPVGPRQFVEDEFFLGSIVGDLNENWKRDLEFVFEPSNEIITWILTGGIGTGKTTAAMLSLAYIAYRISCMRNPQRYYNLLPQSKIVLGMFNVTLKKAGTGYQLLKHYIDNSPYFQHVCPRRKRPTDPIYFPSKNFSIEIGSLAAHALGENIFAFCMDEANFFSKTQDPNIQTRAQSLYNQARTRIYSRFGQYGGGIPGKMILMSSRRYETAFMEELSQRMEADEELRRTTHTSSYALWDTRPERYSGETFQVMVGDDKLASKILEYDEWTPPGYEVVDVPIEELQNFKLDVDLALRDVAGIATAGSWAFFPDHPVIYKSIDQDRPVPFNVNMITTLTPGSENQIQNYIDLEKLCKVERSQYIPKIDPNAKRYAHVDIGLTGDRSGICVGHTVFYNDGTVGLNVDLIIGIQGRRGQEVDLTAIVEFFTWLKQHGFNITKVTYDSYQSRHSVQLLTQQKIVSGILSIDADCYNVFKTLVQTGRWHCYEYNPLLKEMLQLKKAGGPDEPEKADKERPVHPVGGHDDLCDAVAGVAMQAVGLEQIKESEIGEDVVQYNPEPMIIYG